VKELGGPDHLKNDSILFDADGKEIPGSSGYRYFGAAKELPGVRELLFS
jgi:pre-mRNA-splicing factor ISY1